MAVARKPRQSSARFYRSSSRSSYPSRSSGPSLVHPSSRTSTRLTSSTPTRFSDSDNLGQRPDPFHLLSRTSPSRRHHTSPTRSKRSLSRLRPVPHRSFPRQHQASIEHHLTSRGSAIADESSPYRVKQRPDGKRDQATSERAQQSTSRSTDQSGSGSGSSPFHRL